MSDLVQAHRVHRSIYTEPEIFDQEMAKIFGGTWVYVAHESQIPEPNDFITTHLGRRELIVTRDRDGQLRALFKPLLASGINGVSTRPRISQAFPVQLPRLDLFQLW